MWVWKAVVLVVVVSGGGCEDEGGSPSRPDAADASRADSPGPVDSTPDAATDVIADRTADLATDTPPDAPADAAADAGSDGGVACGAGRCSADQLCLQSCSPCGAAPVCEPRADGGACPAGKVSCVHPDTGAAGCANDCSAPPPRCIDVPPACRPQPTCACFAGQLAVACLNISGGHIVAACPP
jgi:hypothetical protein